MSEEIAGVNMRLNDAGVIRELHWHKEGEWSYMIYGRARITAIDAQGRNFLDDVSVGDLWYFPSGIPHSIQGLGADGCEFLLIFDNGHFDEDRTFLINDWFKHVPNEVLSVNLVGIDQFNDLPNPEDYYILAAPVPASPRGDPLMGVAPANPTFSHRVLAQTPDWEGNRLSVWITDSRTFPAWLTIVAALVEGVPGQMRKLYWHPDPVERQYYLQGQAQMGKLRRSDTGALLFERRAEAEPNAGSNARTTHRRETSWSSC